ncbi:MAG: F0F1 ATP synthase subunit epsilon [Rhizobiaceae bacterium]
MAQAFNFELVSPERLLLSGEVSEVVVPGSDGYFTVMANHAPVMSSVKPGVVDVRMADGELKQIFVRGGFADVSPSGLILLAEHAVPLKELAMEDFDGLIRDAEEDLSDADTEAKRERASVALNQLRESRNAIALMKR